MSGICLPIDAVSGAPSFPAAQHRVAQAALLTGRTDRPLGARSGVRPGAEPTVTVTATQWTVTPFNGVLDPSTALTVGPYLFAFLANQTGAINAADQTNARIDRLDVQVPDDPAGASALAAVIVYTPGVAAASPSTPAAPARSFLLGTISVPKAGAGSPSFAAAWPRAVAAGGATPARSSAEYPSSPHVGQYVDDASLGLFRWNGSAWVRPVTVADVVVNDVNTAGTSITADSLWHAVTGWTVVPETPMVGFTYSAGVWTKTADGITRLCDVFGKIAFPSNATGQRGVRVIHNGAVVYEMSVASSSASNTHVPFRWWGSIAPGDTIEIDALVSTAAGNQALNTQAGMNTITIRPSAS